MNNDMNATNLERLQGPANIHFGMCTKSSLDMGGNDQPYGHMSKQAAQHYFWKKIGTHRSVKRSKREKD